MIMYSAKSSSPHPAAGLSPKHILFQLGFIVMATVFCASTSAAQQIEAMKIVFSRSGPTIAPNSADAQPITLYKAGDKYSRIEYPDDPANHTHTLVITKEPDNWVINLVDHTAHHTLDPGPTFISRNLIVWSPKPRGAPDPYKAFRELEFGSEPAFFRQKGARDLGVRKMAGKNAKALAVKDGGTEVTLFLDPETDKPLQLDLTEDGKLALSFHYLEYNTGVSFDPTLFEVPKGTKVTEAK
jgi:hypothetical protein